MDEKRIDLTGFLRLIDFGLRREGDETFAVSEAGIRACPMTDEDWRLLTDEEQIVLMEMAEDARLDFPCSLADVRRWVELNWYEVPENLALALEEAAPGKAPGGEGQAADPPIEPCNAPGGEEQPSSLPIEDLPGTGPIERRERVARILAALQDLDPGLSLEAMPGTKQDLFELCQALDNEPRYFAHIVLRTFANSIKDWVQFQHGQKPGKTTYYRDRVEPLRSKLA